MNTKKFYDIKVTTLMEIGEENQDQIRRKFFDEEIPPEFNVAAGSIIEIHANVYPITFQDNFNLFEYSVEIDPEMSNQNTAINILFLTFCPEGGKKKQNQKWATMLYNGKSILFSSLPDLECENSIEYPQNSTKIYNVKIKQIKQITSKCGKSLLSVCDNALLNAYYSNKFSHLKTKWFDTSISKRISTFILTYGFTSLLVLLKGGVSLIFKPTYRIDRIGTLYDFIKSGITNLEQRQDLLTSLKNMNILTIHSKFQREITISNINWDIHPSQKYFINNEQKKVSVADYFLDVYNFNVRKDDIIIESISFNRTDYYPASSLMISGLTEAENKDQLVKNKINEFKTCDPYLFLDKINKSLEKWGIIIGKSFEIKANVLPSPLLKCRTQQIDHKEFSLKYNEKNKIMDHCAVAISPYLITKPLILIPDSFKDDKKQTFLNNFIETSNKTNVNMQYPDVISVKSIDNNNYSQEIIKYIVHNGTPSFIIIIFHEYNKNLYESLKQLLTIQLGIPSQFCIKENIIDADSKFLTKLMFQITAKTGGIPYYISPESLPLKHTMVIGISSTTNVCAMTASYDFTFSRYYSQTYKLDESNIISSKDIKDFFKKAIDFYGKHSESSLNRIVVYRKSSLTIDILKENEIKAIAEFGISLVYCLVEKRNSVRLFGDNIETGTIVYDKITVNDYAQFYLISKEGTINPTKYTIIHQLPHIWNDDHLVMLTYYLTCCYFGSDKSLRVPLPLIYAEKLADFCQNTLNNESPNQALSSFIHYL